MPPFSNDLSRWKMEQIENHTFRFAWSEKSRTYSDLPKIGSRFSLSGRISAFIIINYITLKSSVNRYELFFYDRPAVHSLREGADDFRVM